MVYMREGTAVPHVKLVAHEFYDFFSLFILRQLLTPHQSLRRNANSLLNIPDASAHSMVAWRFLRSCSVFPRRCMSSATRLSRKTLRVISNRVPSGAKGSCSPKICLTV